MSCTRTTLLVAHRIFLDGGVVNPTRRTPWIFHAAGAVILFPLINTGNLALAALGSIFGVLPTALTYAVLLPYSASNSRSRSGTPASSLLASSATSPAAE
ncbi:hypothetical protein CBI38_22730 [Rhodococcus oxybenzonivorans]|uniref:Uncharacterized protein n=1 Tax=Rhodococcus oxybenzonivorans TaxID=1990687 RepID=A0A2S2BZ87_9NOCA|nr:hypothetical protein CBI38_22730 [Rhodococcus oxybenzonivorans]